MSQYSDVVSVNEAAEQIRKILEGIRPNLHEYVFTVATAEPTTFKEVKPGRTFFSKGAEMVKLPEETRKSNGRTVHAVLVPNGVFCTFDNPDEPVYVPKR